MIKKIKKKKKQLISEVRLPASQLLYQHQFQYGGIFHSMFPASNCLLLTPITSGRFYKLSSYILYVSSTLH